MSHHDEFDARDEWPSAQTVIEATRETDHSGSCDLCGKPLELEIHAEESFLAAHHPHQVGTSRRWRGGYRRARVLS